VTKRIAIILGLAAILVAVYLWRRHHSPTAVSTTTTGSATPPTQVFVATHGTPRPDPATLARGAFTGRVTASTTNAPIANAKVCAYGRSASLAGEWFARPLCATSDQTGAFAIEKLFPGTYAITAMAPTYLPGGHHPGGDRRAKDVRLALGEKKTSIDIALDPGGVEITGTVEDLTGGPVAHARVWTQLEDYPAATEADDKGAFSLWLAPGRTDLVATADGYASGYASAYAPGIIEIFLAPESSIAGTVIDGASGKPVEGARVQPEWSEASAVYSDGRGAFRISHLAPGRWRIVATTENGAGSSEGTVRAALGEAAEGVIVKLYPAVRVTGRVLVSGTEQSCPSAHAALNDVARNSTQELRPEAEAPSRSTVYAPRRTRSSSGARASSQRANRRRSSSPRSPARTKCGTSRRRAACAASSARRAGWSPRTRRCKCAKQRARTAPTCSTTTRRRATEATSCGGSPMARTS
jgi:protocatechuate 3,4-dioxygenase beta subunit